MVANASDDLLFVAYEAYSKEVHKLNDPACFGSEISRKLLTNPALSCNFSAEFLLDFWSTWQILHPAKPIIDLHLVSHESIIVFSVSGRSAPIVDREDVEYGRSVFKQVNDELLSTDCLSG